jgi:hypothetical protein
VVPSLGRLAPQPQTRNVTFRLLPTRALIRDAQRDEAFSSRRAAGRFEKAAFHRLHTFAPSEPTPPGFTGHKTLAGLTPRRLSADLASLDKPLFHEDATMTMETPNTLSLPIIRPGGKPCVKLSDVRMLRSGFTPGQRFDVCVGPSRLTLRLSPKGLRVVPANHAGSDAPQIGLYTPEQLKVFGGAIRVRARFLEREISLEPVIDEHQSGEVLALKDAVVGMAHAVPCVTVIQKQRLIEAGFLPGMRYTVVSQNRAVSFRLSEEGNRTVEAVRGGQAPTLHLRSSTHLRGFKVLEKVCVVFLKGEVRIVPAGEAPPKGGVAGRRRASAGGTGDVGSTPKPKQVWKHSNGLSYRVLHVTNTTYFETPRAPDVVFQGSVGDVWSLPLAEWHQHFTREQSHSRL